MRSWFMLQRWRLRTKMRGVWSGLVRAVRTRLARLQPCERLASVLPLIVLAASQAACSTPSTLPMNAARNPSRPAVSTPQPSKPYSESVADSLKRWAGMLTATPPTR